MNAATVPSVPSSTRRVLLGGLAAGGVAALVGCASSEVNDSTAPTTGSGRASTVATSVTPVTTSPKVELPERRQRLSDPYEPARRRSPNWYLSANFAPVPFETTAHRLRVDGEIPAELRGSLIRIGPNPFNPDPSRYHWFLGSGMVHSFAFGDDGVSYRSRWVRTETATDALGERAIAGQPADPYPIANGANTTVIAHGGKLLATYESALPTEIGSDLSTIGRHDFGGALTTPMTAHPKIDPATGEMLFFGVELLAQPHLRFHRADVNGELVETTGIELPGPSMMHDFAITEGHLVFVDVPVVYEPFGLLERPIPASWRDDYVTRIGIAPRVSADNVRWLEIDPCYVGHVLNAYEEASATGVRIVLDATRHTRFFDRDIFGVGEGEVTLSRWTIDLSTGSVVHDVLDERSQELPRIDDRLTARRHRFGYAVLSDQQDGRLGFGGVVKHDFEMSTSKNASLPVDARASEPVFVPRPGSDIEDNGWVITVVYDPVIDLSSIAVIDAQRFDEPPIASIALPVRVPHHFHGTFLPA